MTQSPHHIAPLLSATMLLAAAIPLLSSCADDGTSTAAAAIYRGEHRQSLSLGSGDNVEVIKWFADGKRALLVASKARRITLLAVTDGLVSEVRSSALASSDPTESELTHLAIAPGGRWAALTRTTISKDSDGKTTHCGGELLLVSVELATFGELLATVGVGPMPDAVAIAPDGKTAVVANERDVVWGKCEGVQGLAPPSLSIIDLSAGPEQATERQRVVFRGEDKREPEHIAFSTGGDLFAVTLQDSNELALFRLSALSAKSDASDADADAIVALPANSIGQAAWPDGVTRFADGQGKEHFAVAGEGNDVIYLVDTQGALVASLELGAQDIPTDFPRDGTWGPLFRPDSITSFRFSGESYLAASLKACGAVGLWKVSDMTNASFVQAIKIGAKESSDATQESSVGSEGISATGTGLILIANELESSVSLVAPHP
jgi:hypothetical protein